MPVYEYKPTGEESCERCADGFETRQPMAEDPLTSCPVCGAPVARIISAFQVGKGNILSASNLKDKGFTRLTKKDQGVYEKD